MGGLTYIRGLQVRIQGLRVAYAVLLKVWNFELTLILKQKILFFYFTSLARLWENMAQYSVDKNLLSFVRWKDIK